MKKQILSLISILIVSLTTQAKAPSHESWDALLKKHVSVDGKVNYKGFIKDSITLNTYLNLLAQYPPDEKTWPVNQQKAYWINAYNAFTVKLIVQNYPVKSIKEVGAKMQIPFVNTPWDIKFIKLGKQVYDLNQIEHGILRKKFNDPRIHFVLVCASKSCPILLNRAYTHEQLEAQLDAQARVFLADKTKNQLSPSRVNISKLFNWYAGDFKVKDATVLEYINQYAPIKIDKDAKISYLPYSWELNE